MRKRLLALLLFLLPVLFEGIAATKLFYTIDLKREIGSTTWLYVANGMREARELQADGVIIHMNTYGGAVNFADSIRTTLLNSEMPVYCFVDNNAASAGALIAIACDSIYMRTGANIGAATVVDQSGSVLPDKYQSYMRSTIRSTAEAQGKVKRRIDGVDTLVWRRDPLIAEAMVDARTVAPGADDSTKVLTLTTSEAIHWGFCEAKVESIEELIKERLGEDDYTLKSYEPSTFVEVKGFLMNPIFQSVLVMLIIGGIYFELQSPGIGFPLAVSVVAATLYFAPLYLDGLAANWEILLFVIGIIFLGMEIFVLPGFGVAGVVGIVAMSLGLILALLSNVVFDFEGVDTRDAIRAMLTVLVGFLASGGLAIWIGSRIGHGGFLSAVSLESTQEVSEGYLSVDPTLKRKVGATGVAATLLRPSGKIRIDGELYDAISLYGFIESGSTVRVVRQESAQLYVEEMKENKIEKEEI